MLHALASLFPPQPGDEVHRQRCGAVERALVQHGGIQVTQRLQGRARLLQAAQPHRHVGGDTIGMGQLSPGTRLISSSTGRVLTGDIADSLTGTLRDLWSACMYVLTPTLHV
jgi:hypothetical protein